jgi:hypothetical protein
MSLGVITAGQRRDLAVSGGSPRPVLASLPRCVWQDGASGWCEKVPNIAIEPGRALGEVS